MAFDPTSGQVQTCYVPRKWQACAGHLKQLLTRSFQVCMCQTVTSQLHATTSGPVSQKRSGQTRGGRAQMRKARGHAVRHLHGSVWRILFWLLYLKRDVWPLITGCMQCLHARLVPATRLGWPYATGLAYCSRQQAAGSRLKRACCLPARHCRKRATSGHGIDIQRGQTAGRGGRHSQYQVSYLRLDSQRAEIVIWFWDQAYICLVLPGTACACLLDTAW